MSSPTATAHARELLGVRALTNASLTTWLHRLPGVDPVGADARAAALGTRSIKTTSKAWAIDAAIGMIDLTTLEGADTEGKVRSLCAKAMTRTPATRQRPRSQRSVSTDVPCEARGCIPHGRVVAHDLQRASSSRRSRSALWSTSSCSTARSATRVVSVGRRRDLYSWPSVAGLGHHGAKHDR